MRFANYIQNAHRQGHLVVQPRMGMARLDAMRAGLTAVKSANATTIGTITLDSYTRVGDHASARQALEQGLALNGFPLVAHGVTATRQMLHGIQGNDFPVQVRHGTALPEDIFSALIAAGVDATEGGPISYCLPYSRTALPAAIQAWAHCCEMLCSEAEHGNIIHLESFGGCLLGQLCPPSLLVAIGILEGIFFQHFGVRSLSLSYAQQTNPSQDLNALRALRRLANEYLGKVDWHVVLYTYMGVFPHTVEGAQDLLSDSVLLAVQSNTERIIVKTPAEAHRIPSIEENIGALELAANLAQSAQFTARRIPDDFDGDTYAEAKGIIESVLELAPRIETCLSRAFVKGRLDVPYCLHCDNAGRSRSFIDQNGALQWQNVGAMAIHAPCCGHALPKIKPNDFLQMLSFVADKADAPYDGVATLQAAPAPQWSGKRIAIIGSGPRGLAVLEHLVAQLSKQADLEKVKIILIDEVQIGTGRIWRSNQSQWLLQNTINSQMTMYSAPADSGPARAGAGPSFDQWLSAPENASLPRIGLSECAPRYLYGKYLEFVYQSICANLPGQVELEAVLARVDAIQTNDNGSYDLTLNQGKTVDGVHKIVFALGHPHNQLQAGELAYKQFSEKHSKLSYIAGDSAADLPLASIGSDSTVAIIGMGLGFYDIVAELTLGRGGRFETVDGQLRYIKSGREVKKIFAGSRGGVPILARGKNQKVVGKAYQATFMTKQAISELRQQALSRSGSIQLDFQAVVLPLIQAEMDHVYYKTWVRQRDGELVEARFARDHESCIKQNGDLKALLQHYEMNGIAPLNISALARPFANQQFAGPGAYQQAVLHYLQQDLLEAALGNIDGPKKAGLDVLRDVRDTIRSTVDFAGLTANSYRDDFLGRFAPECSFVAAGPPMVTVQRAVALMQAGILDIAGPNAVFSCDEAQQQFCLESQQVSDSKHYCDVLIDSRVPTTDLHQDKSPLTQSLLQSGAISEYVMSQPDGDLFACKSWAVSESPFHPINKQGKMNLDWYVLGVPTENTRWFTLVGSDTPNALTRFSKDAEAISCSLIRCLQQLQLHAAA